MSQKSYDKSPTVYLVPTPIGNMDDITVRSLNILKEVSVIFSEDTRVTATMLKYFEISKKLISSHEYNEESNKDKFLKYLQDGQDVAIVTDQGTPIISDPGYNLVIYAVENNFNVVGLPGATALIPALITSGISPIPFMFYGFLNNKSSKRVKELNDLKNNKYTMIFYEAPHRIVDSLNDMLTVFGDRKISLSREISKKYEEIFRGTISEVLKEINNIKGELVIVVSGNNNKISYDELPLIEHINYYKEQGFTDMEAIKIVSKERKVSKNTVYDEYHNIRRNK